MSCFESDLSDSAADFLRVVWPIIDPMVEGGKIIPLESVTNDAMAGMLDKYSGIDAWHISNGRQIRGVASRIQWGNDWNTFTVRYSRDSGAKTEYEKRKADIESNAGWLYPHLTVQAFIAGEKGSNGDLISVAIIKTKDLIGACERVVNGEVDERKKGGFRRTGNATFIWLDWDWLKQSGYEIDIYKEHIESQKNNPFNCFRKVLQGLVVKNLMSKTTMKQMLSKTSFSPEVTI